MAGHNSTPPEAQWRATGAVSHSEIYLLDTSQALADFTRVNHEGPRGIGSPLKEFTPYLRHSQFRQIHAVSSTCFFRCKKKTPRVSDEEKKAARPPGLTPDVYLYSARRQQQMCREGHASRKRLLCRFQEKETPGHSGPHVFRQVTSNNTPPDDSPTCSVAAHARARLSKGQGSQLLVPHETVPEERWLRVGKQGHKSQ